jgi:hypothetical protein
MSAAVAPGEGMPRGMPGSEAKSLFQIPPETKPKPRPGGAVLVRVRLDASVHIFWKHKALYIKEIKNLSGNKARMERNKISPNNNRASELYQCPIVPCFLLIPHQRFPKAVQPRMAYLHHPPPRFEPRILFLLFSTIPDVCASYLIPSTIFCAPTYSPVKADIRPFRIRGNN